MPVIVSCPSCGNQGELPDGIPNNVTLTCRQCGVRFSPQTATKVVVPPPAVPEGGSGAVWVGPGPAPVIPLPPVVQPPDQPAVIPLDPAPPGLPTVITPEDAAAHRQWLADETRRFQNYVDRQLGVFQKTREQLVEFESKVRADAVVREQVLNRERAVLDARVGEVAKREAELAAAIAQHGEQLTTELGRLMAGEREQLTRRADELAQAEQSLQRRLAELDEHERTVRDELDIRRADLDRQQQRVAERELALRNRPALKGGPAFFVSPPPPPPPPGQRAGG